MADETYTIDLDVDSRGVTVAEKRLKMMQKRLKKIHSAEKRLASTRKRARKLQDSRHLVVASRRLAQVRKQTVGLTRQANASARQANAAGRQADSIRAQSDRILARSAKARIKRDRRARTLSSRSNLKLKRSGEIARASSMGFQNFSLSAMGAAKSLGGVAIKAALAVTAVTALGTVAFAKAVIGAKDFNLNSRIAFDALTGGAESGARAMALSKSTASEFGMEIQATTNQFKKLLAAQFSIEQAETFIKLGADLRAIGTDAEGVKSAIRAITQIKAKGRLQADELLQLSEANISQELIFGELQKSMALSSVDEVRKKIEAGEVKSAMALAAIRGAILKKTGSSEAGEAGRKWAATSIEAMQNRMGNAKFDLLGTVADISPKAFEKLALIGKDVARFFEEFQGKQVLADIFTSAINGLGALVKIGKAFFSGFVDRLGEGTDDFDRFMRTLTNKESLESFQQLGRSMAAIADGTATAVLAFTQLATFLDSFELPDWVQSFVGFIDDLKVSVDAKAMEVQPAFQSFGTNMANGLISGIQSKFGAVKAAALSMAGTVRSAFTGGGGGLLIRSPSKVFEKYGHSVVEGFDKGVQTPAVKAASNGAASPGGGSSVGSTSNTFNMGGMSVNTEVNEASDGPAIAAQMESSAMGIFGQAFEKMALAGGTA